MIPIVAFRHNLLTATTLVGALLAGVAGCAKAEFAVPPSTQVRTPDGATVEVVRSSAPATNSAGEPFLSSTAISSTVLSSTKASDTLDARPETTRSSQPVPESVVESVVEADGTKNPDSAKFTIAAAPPAATPSSRSLPPAEPFQFAESASGKLQSERLPPPQRVPLENFPWVSEPRSAAGRFPEVLSAQLYVFPVELPGGELRSYPIEHPEIARVLPTLDRPSLPQFSIGLVPKEPEMPIATRSRVVTVSPDGIPELTVTLQLYDVKPAIQDDPGFASARAALLSPLPFADPLPAAPEKLTIPDPFDYLRHVKVKDAPSESLSPAVSYERPAAIVLPLDKP